MGVKKIPEKILKSIFRGFPGTLDPQMYKRYLFLGVRSTFYSTSSTLVLPPARRKFDFKKRAGKIACREIYEPARGRAQN